MDGAQAGPAHADHAAPRRPVHGQCAVELHVVSFSVVGPPTGAEN
jgi:hypothetical protein